MSKLQAILEDFEKTVRRLREILQLKDNSDIVRDSAIKRFELVYDLGWKATKIFLEKEHNVICHSPKVCFKEAFQQGLIDYDKFWLDMVDLRNATVHAYNEKLADKVYKKLPEVLVYFQKLLVNLKKEVQE